jgi:hypothetical protein
VSFGLQFEARDDCSYGSRNALGEKRFCDRDETNGVIGENGESIHERNAAVDEG